MCDFLSGQTSTPYAFRIKQLLIIIKWNSEKGVRADLKDGRTCILYSLQSDIVQHHSVWVQQQQQLQSISRRLSGCRVSPYEPVPARAIPQPINIPLALCWLLTGAHACSRPGRNHRQASRGVRLHCYSASLLLYCMKSGSDRKDKAKLHAEWNISCCLKTITKINIIINEVL